MQYTNNIYIQSTFILPATTMNRLDDDTRLLEELAYTYIFHARTQADHQTDKVLPDFFFLFSAMSQDLVDKPQYSITFVCDF